MVCLIYRVTCKVDETFSYVGQTRHSLEIRKADFIGKKVYLKYSDTLQDIPHTDDDFTYELLEQIDTTYHSYERERYWINKYGTSNIGMRNIIRVCTCGKVLKCHVKSKLNEKHINSKFHKKSI
jgi:hypothetical protein